MTKIWKRLGLGVGGLLLSALLGFGGATLKANARLSKQFEVHESDLALPGAEPEAVARGAHLVVRYGCSGCHGADLSGGVMLDDPAIGVLRGPNLTPGKGSRVRDYTMTDWDRIVRHGVLPDGKPALMPSEDFFEMADRELLDIVAYVRSRPPIDREVPGPKLGPVGRVLVAIGKLPLTAEAAGAAASEHRAAPPVTADTVEFGKHLAATCVGCHRTNFIGGPMPFGPPDWPAAANLTPHGTGLQKWSFEDFDRALTEGVSKDGRRLAAPMSEVVVGTKAMLPTERKALWTYLQSLAPAEKGR